MKLSAEELDANNIDIIIIGQVCEVNTPTFTNYSSLTILVRFSILAFPSLH